MAKEWEMDPLALRIIRWYLSDDRDTQEKVRRMLRHLIQLCGTHDEVAKELKIMRRTVTYRLNHAKVIHLEDALKIFALLQSKKLKIEINLEGF